MCINKVCIITNLPAPYRLPIFEHLSDSYELSVYFCAHESSDRHWGGISNRPEWLSVLPGFNIGRFRINPTLIYELLTNDYDAILVGENGETTFATLVAWAVSRLTRTHFGIWTEGIDTPWYETKLQHNLGTRILDKIRPYLYSQTTVCLGYSKAAGEWLRKRGVPDNKIITGQQVVPSSELPEPGGSTQVADDSVFTFCYLGYLKERKGIRTLIEAFLGADLDNAQLLIAGDGPERESLERLAGDQEKITFLGYVSASTKAEIYEQSDAFVFPSKHDAWGLVTNESLHYGLPVITSPYAASHELVERYNAGIVVDAPTKESWMEALEKMESNHMFRQRVTQNARSVTTVSDVGVGAAPFEEAFERLINS